MSGAKAERPVFWIVAGPNGSGKSSAYQASDIEAFARTVWIINPDLLTARIQSVEKLDLRSANLAAVQHAVPEDKIVERYARSLEQMPWFLNAADRATLFDNSGTSSRPIGQKKDGVVTLDPAALPQVVAAVRKIAAE